MCPCTPRLLRPTLRIQLVSQTQVSKDGSRCRILVINARNIVDFNLIEGACGNANDDAEGEHDTPKHQVGVLEGDGLRLSIDQNTERVEDETSKQHRSE